MRDRFAGALRNWCTQQELASLCGVTVATVYNRLCTMDVKRRVIGNRAIFILSQFANKRPPKHLAAVSTQPPFNITKKLPKIGPFGISFEVFRRAKAIGLSNSHAIAVHLNVNQNLMNELLYGRISARNVSGEWCAPALHLADFFECAPDELFDMDQQWPVGLCDPDRVARYELERLSDTSCSDTPYDSAVLKQLKFEITKVLSSIPAREEAALRAVFGIGCEQITIGELAEKWGYTDARIHQICIGALRRLGHVKYAMRLRSFLQWEDDANSRDRAPTLPLRIDWQEDHPPKSPKRF
jgi:hypothetical protein